MRSRRAKAPLGMLLAVVASSTALAMAGPSPAVPGPALREWPEWPHRVTCGHVSFDPIAVFSGPLGAERGPLPAEAGLRRELRTTMNWISRHNWRLGGHKPGMYEFFHGRLGAELESIVLTKQRGRWRMNSYDQRCYLRTLRHGQWATSWFLADKQPPLTPETRRIHVYVGGRCSRDEDPAALAEPPEFREIDGKLLMTIWLRPDPSPSDELCQPGLGPGPPLTVDLPEPLGDRELFDGGEFPPAPADYLEKGGGVPLRAG
jgi:hypothetical protein